MCLFLHIYFKTTSFLFICLSFLAIVKTNNPNSKKVFELNIGQTFGVLGCRKQCKDRKGCVNVQYSSNTLSCVLKFNTSSNHKENACGAGLCVQRSIQTQSGRPVTVWEMHNDLDRTSEQNNCDETQLSFFPITKNLCKVSGKQNNMLEPHPSAAWNHQCKARADETFLRNESYSWTVSVTQTNNVPSTINFDFRSVHKITLLSGFSLLKRYGLFQIGKSTFKKLSCKSNLLFKFTLSKGTLQVKDLHTRLSMLRLTIRSTRENRFSLFLKMYTLGESDLKMMFNERHTGSCS